MKEKEYKENNIKAFTIYDLKYLLNLMGIDVLNKEYNYSILKEDSAEYIRGDFPINNVHDKIFRTILSKEKEVLYLINKFSKVPLKVTDIEKYNSSYITKAMLIEKIRNIEDFKEILIEIRKRIKNEEELELFEKMIRYVLLNNMEIEEREKFIEELIIGGEEKMLNSQRVIRNEFRRSRIDGIRQGRKEGRIGGITDGIKQGRLEIIKSMLKENLPIQLISKISNLSEEEIQKLK